MKIPWSAKVFAVLVLAGGVGGIALAAGDGPCDMKTVEKAFYCEPCKTVLTKKELVSKKKYYECEGCGKTAEKAGKCESCDKKLVKKVTDKDVCPKCYGKTIAVEACVKTAYACPKCGAVSVKAAKCETCKAAYKKVQVRALIHYRCPACGKTSLTPGNCDGAECEKKGEPLVRTCSQSGQGSHVGPADKAGDGGEKKK